MTNNNAPTLSSVTCDTYKKYVAISQNVLENPMVNLQATLTGLVAEIPTSNDRMW